MSEQPLHIDDDGLDELMDQAFLNLDPDDPRNKPVIEAVSNTVLLNKPKAPAKWKQLMRKFYPGLLVIIVLFPVLFAYRASKPVPAAKQTATSNVTIPVKEPVLNGRALLPSGSNPGNNQGARHADSISMIAVNTATDHLMLTIDSTLLLSPDEKALPSFTETEEPQIDAEVQTIHENAYNFPQLTDKEIRANNKQRKKMLEQLLKMGKSKYLLIPDGEVDYKGETKAVMNCYLSQTEVTNLEYRTFLFDLLIQNKKELFLKAKPKQSLWVNSNGTSAFDDFKTDYFSEKRFNDYPVVNISPEGANLYCEWLNELYENNSDTEDQNRKKISIRLPKESEWIYCALGRFKNVCFPWGTDSIQNRKHCFLANFCVQKSREKFIQPYGYTCKINLNAYTSAGLVLNNDKTATVKVSEYNPNWYGLYCMSGNVSEMVISDKLNIPKTLGGNWNSDVDYLKINGPDEFKGVSLTSPFIGFRPIIIVHRTP
jgi:formylglycine-generating enzyme required for sulfatase activity